MLRRIYSHSGGAEEKAGGNKRRISWYFGSDKRGLGGREADNVELDRIVREHRVAHGGSRCVSPVHL